MVVSGGPGNTTDWIALYPVGAADSAYINWSYLTGTGIPPSSGLTSATLTRHAPLISGDYEWRLFANDGWTRIATSSVLTVTASAVSFSVNGVVSPAAASAVTGSNLAVAFTGGPGNPTDWIGLAPAGSPDSTLVDWRYLNDTTVPPAAGLGSGNVQFLAPATAGNYEVRFFAHGTYGRLATATVAVSASLAALTIDDVAPPTVVSVNAGTHVNVGITGGPAQPGDWVGLFAATAADSAHLAWRYLNGTTTLPSSGVANASVMFGVPVAAGSYEFRFFNANTFTRLATSTTMVVSASSATLSVNGVAAPTSTTAAAGLETVVSVTGGPANVGDWVGLYAAGAPDSTLLDWRYLNDTAQLPSAGVSTATLHFGAPTTPGAYEFRFFVESGGGLLATSGPVVVPQTVAEISVNGVLPPTTVTAAPGSSISVDITDGPANPTDWVALAAQGAPNSSYVAWQYLNGISTPPTTGLSSATLSFVLPSVPGTHEVRLFANNTNQRITTSAPISTSPQGPADSVPPTIIAQTSPEPLGAWHNTPTTVTFSCKDDVGIASCSAPAIVSTDGFQQLIVGTAVDLAGNHTTYDVFVNVDSTPPQVQLTDPPTPLTTSEATIGLTASVADGLSGIVSATCNGIETTSGSGSVSCSVGLKPGRNDVIVTARDAAGNAASASVRITRTGTGTSMGLTPTSRTLLVGRVTTLALTDEFGTIVTGATWSSSDPAVVDVSADDPPVISASEAGTATITAVKNGLSVDASITVLAGTALPYGAPLWSTNGAPGFNVVNSIKANRVDLSVPDVFSIEKSGESTTVRGVTASGEVLWQAVAPGEPLMGDSFGGILAGLNPSPSLQYTGYVRFGAPSGSPGWRFDSMGTVGAAPAQGPDGTIYAVERYPTGAVNPDGSPILAHQVVVLDGSNGAVRARYPLARERQVAFLPGSGCAVLETSPHMLGPIVGSDGYGYIALRQFTKNGHCPNSFTVHVGIILLRISPAGVVSPTTVYSEQCISGCEPAPLLAQLHPDGIGGTLLRAYYHTQLGGAWNEPRVSRISDGVVQFNKIVGFGEWTTLTDGSGVAYLIGNGLRKVNVTNWETIWIKPILDPEVGLPPSPLMALSNSGLAMLDRDTNLLHELDADGASLRSAPFIGWGANAAFGLTVSGNTGTGTLETRISLPLNDAPSFGGGEGTQQNSWVPPRGSDTLEMTAVLLMAYMYQSSSVHRLELGGKVCGKGNEFFWHDVRVGETHTSPDPNIVPEVCPDGALTVGFAHTHPPDFPGDQGLPVPPPGQPVFEASLYPSGYWRGEHYYDSHPNTPGDQGSDFKVADDHFQFAFPQYRDLTWFVVSQDEYNRLPMNFFRYRRTPQKQAKNNLERYNLSNNTWVPVQPRW